MYRAIGSQGSSPLLGAWARGGEKRKKEKPRNALRPPRLAPRFPAAPCHLSYLIAPVLDSGVAASCAHRCQPDADQSDEESEKALEAQQ